MIMLKHLLRTGIVGVIAVAVIGSVVAASQSTTGAMRPAAQPPAKSYTPPQIEPLVPETGRTPVKPTVGDNTVLKQLPAGTGIQTVPAGVARPVRTNSWWSAGALDAWPAPVFPLPFKGIFNADGLTLFQVGRKVHERAVMHTAEDPLRITDGGQATGASAIIAGDWDVTFRVRAGGKTAFDATMTQGSPFVFIRPGGGTLTAVLPGGAVPTVFDCKNECGSAVHIRAPTSTYMLVSPTRNAFTIKGGIVTARVESGRALVTVVAIAPESDPVAYLAPALRPFTGTQASYSLTSSQVHTTFRFPQPTIMGLLPHQFISLAAAPKDTPSSGILGSPGTLIGTFHSLRGPIRLYRGNGFSTAVPRPSILPSLPPLQNVVSGQALRETLRREITGNVPPSGDAYWIGKGILRTAQLAELADLVGDAQLRAQALQQARYSLGGFCAGAPGSPLSFAWDPVAGGIVALPAGYGSEHYNDHHFHYGYYTHAAAIIARMDPDFLKKYGDCFRLLARDIASTDRKDPSFPYMRYFDPYGGHSWANGLTSFGDGTNQESVSEAMHAWYALALYGRTSGNAKLEDLGTWMFAQESQAARVYWLNAVPAADALPEEFAYPIISILWSGKADYATFFDGSDGAVRGIQFFPVTTALLPIVDRQIVKGVVAPAAQAAPPTIWKSGLSLVQSLTDPTVSIPADMPIEPGYSRAYVDYWLQTTKALGEPVSATGTCAGYVFKNGNKHLAAIYRFPHDPPQCAFYIGIRSIALPKLQVGWNLRSL